MEKYVLDGIFAKFIYAQITAQISKIWTFDPALKVKSDLLSRLVGRDYEEGTLAFTGHSSLISEKGSN